MPDKSANNRRIAKNTAELYVRMLFLMGVNLFTTRVVLHALGIEDFGIYNVVGGIVALFSILSHSLSSANSRFLNYEMGRGNYDRLNAVFSTGVTIQIILAIIIVVLTEIAGTWFLNNKMVIPSDRIIAANWVLQFSILTFCINLISVPYNASIIAHEKMTAFAYVSIYEGLAKLLICYLVIISPIDKLIVYSALVCLIQLTVRFIYKIYCKHNFDECTYRFQYDKSLLKDIFSYAGWNIVGGSAAVLRTQGGNILINLFAGPAVNAACGVANQVNRAVTGFSANFMTAVKPQITKSYAAGDLTYMTTLVNQSARLSYYMLLFLSLPIIVNIDFILSIWLKIVPDRTTTFVILTIIFTLIESLSNPLITAQLATGKVRNYQLLVGGINLLNLPVSYVFLKLGTFPEIVLLVAIALSIVCLIARLVMLKQTINFNIKSFTKAVILNCSIVTTLSLVVPIILSHYCEPNWWSFILSVFICISSTAIIVLFVGCSKEERTMILSKISPSIKNG